MWFKIYIIVTIYIGSSVASFFGISQETNNFLLSIHYRALPFLLFAIASSSNYKFKDLEIGLISICFLSLLIAYSIGRSAMLAVSVNNAIEPVFLIALLRTYKGEYKTFTKKALLYFFLFECLVAWYEVATRHLLFADTAKINQDYLDYMLSYEMRAYSLHGHPLQNAFLVSILSYFFLTAKGKIMFRYGLFAIGYITLFAFNTRSSIYLMALIFLIVLLRDMNTGRMSSSQKWMAVFVIAVFSLVLSYFVVKYEFGSRLFSYDLSTKDASSNTRYMLIGIIMNLPLESFWWGMDAGIDIIRNQYDFYAIENSLANFIITNGFLYTITWCVLLYFCLKPINKDKKKFNLSFLVFFALLNANNALMTETPIILCYVLALYSLDSLESKKDDLSISRIRFLNEKKRGGLCPKI